MIYHVIQKDQMIRHMIYHVESKISYDKSHDSFQVGNWEYMHINLNILLLHIGTTLLRSNLVERKSEAILPSCEAA